MATCITPSHSSDEANITDRTCVQESDLLARLAAMCGSGSCEVTTKNTSCGTWSSELGWFDDECNTRCAPACPTTRKTNCNTLCAEDNTQTIIRETKTQVYKNSAAFAVPIQGQRIRVPFEGITEIAVGAYLWARNIGMLKIYGFNRARSEIELENDGQSCGVLAAPGTPIPSCTPFVLTPPPCTAPGAGTSTSFPHLIASFIAPELNACVDIALSTVAGIQVNKVVSINGGLYTVSAIKSASIITICNTGAGLTPGTIVQPNDANGNPITPIVPVDENPCTNPPIDAGALMVCANSIIQPLNATDTGQIPVYNSVTNTWSAETLGIPVVECTTTTVPFTIDPDLPPETAYYVTVANSGIFTVGQQVVLTESPFIVTEIPDALHVRIQPLVAPFAIVPIPAGSTICAVDCCTALDTRVTSIEREIMDGGALSRLWAVAAVADAPAGFTGLIASPGTILSGGNITSLAIVNSSPVFNMGFIANLTSHARYELQGATGEAAEVRFITYAKVTLTPVLPTPDVVFDDNDCNSVLGGGVSNRYSLSRTQSFYDVVPPNSTKYFWAGSVFSYQFGDLTTGVNLLDVGVRLTVVGVAVR